MKTILCFGDSNTWGFIPGTGDRFPRDVRWPGVLARELGDGYHVIEEGLSGRTAIWDNPFEDHLNGKPYLVPCLRSHSPLDLVTIMLGTNDVGYYFHLSPADVAAGVGTLVRMVARSATGPDGAPPRVLVIAPPPMRPLPDWDEYALEAAAKTREFPRYFRAMADDEGASFLDTAPIVQSSDVDGVHFDAANHHALGFAVAAQMRTILEA